MKDYVFQYRREQRFETVFTAADEATARKAAEKWVEGKAGPMEDVSDDNGELEMIEERECTLEEK